MRQKNPFLISGYNSPDYFCDREEETKRLIAAMENDRNVTLIAPRRYGKTGLIHNLFWHLPKDFESVYLDIYGIRNLSEFTAAFASAVVGKLDSPSQKAFKRVLGFFRSCRPTMTPQADGSVKYSFDVAPTQAEATLQETFEYLRKREARVVIAIDEFQQIREFPEKGVEAILRSYIQFVPWVRFIFSGSSQHLMSEMFVSAQGPFYQSTEIMSLDVISLASYETFARRLLNEAGIGLEGDVFAELYRRFDGVTWYLQAVLNKWWEFGEDVDDVSHIVRAVGRLIVERELVYQDLIRSQGETQRAVLEAIAAEGVVSEPTSQEFVRTHRLSAPSTVRAVLASLKEKDLVFKSESGWIVYDRLFGKWLKENA